MLEFGLDSVLREISRRKARTVAIQVPEGMKQSAWGIAEKIEERTGANAVVFTDPCFGACDTAWQRAKFLGADLLLHFGHAEMVKGGEKTVYVPVRYKIKQGKITSASARFASLAKGDGIGKVALCATINYAHVLGQIAKELAKNKIKTVIGKGDSRIAVAGQVLGCNFSAVKSAGGGADAILFVGDGRFHPLGISCISKKPLFVLEPCTGAVEKFPENEKDSFIRKRYAAIAVAKQAGKFAVVVSTKEGQARMKAALHAKELLEKAEKKAIVMACDFIRPEYFEGVGIEAIVDTACPRIAIDDAGLFRQPVITIPELEIMLGIRKIENYEII